MNTSSRRERITATMVPTAARSGRLLATTRVSERQRFDAAAVIGRPMKGVFVEISHRKGDENDQAFQNNRLPRRQGRCGRR
jgi:hypothetical protein